MKILIMLLLVICGLVSLQFDDSPNSEVTDYVSLIENRMLNGSQAYLFLSGIAAIEGENILSRGEELLARYNDPTNKSLAMGSVDEKKDENNKLSIADKNNGLYCKLWEAECLGDIVGGSSEWEDEIQNFSVIAERYERFISYSEYTTITKPDATEQYPEYKYLSYGNRIRILSALSLAESGRAEDAIEMLRNDNRYLRKHLELADNLIHKMIFVILLANNLDVVVYMHSAHNMREISEIPYLSSSEINMEYPFAREFVMVYNYFLELDRHPEFFRVGGKIPGWLVRSVFKPHMTMNDSVGNYTKLIKLANLSAKDFSVRILNTESNQKKERRFRNYAGSILNEISMPEYSDYIARLHDLNCKISLTNYVLSGQSKQLENPYGSSYGKKTDSDYFICLDGPLEDKRNLRCIRTKI